VKKLQEYEVGVGMKSTDSVSGNSVVSDCSLFVVLYNLHIITSTAGTLTALQSSFCISCRTNKCWNVKASWVKNRDGCMKAAMHFSVVVVKLL